MFWWSWTLWCARTADVSNEDHIRIGYLRHGSQTQTVGQGLPFRYGSGISLAEGECLPTTNETYPKLGGTRSAGKSEGNSELVRQSGNKGAHKYPRIRGYLLQLPQSLVDRIILADGSPPARGHGGDSSSKGIRHGPREATLVKHAAFPRYQSTLPQVPCLLLAAPWTRAPFSWKKIAVIFVELFACGVQAIDGPPSDGSSDSKADQGTSDLTIDQASSNPERDKLAPFWIAVAIILACGLYRGISWIISREAESSARPVHHNRNREPSEDEQQAARYHRKAFLWGSWSFANTIIAAIVFSPAAQVEYYVQWCFGILSILSISKYQQIYYQRQKIMGEG